MNIRSEYIEDVCPFLPVVVPARESQAAPHLPLMANHETSTQCLPRNKSISRPQSERSSTFWRKIHQRTTLPWGLIPFDVSSAGSDQHRGSIPDCATPSGFLNLMTLFSACTASALFHAESALGIFCFQRFLPPSSRHSFRRALPLWPFVSRRGFRDWCIWEIRSR